MTEKISVKEERKEGRKQGINDRNLSCLKCNNGSGIPDRV